MLSFIQIQSYGFNHTFQCSLTSFLFKISGSHPIVETNPWNVDSIVQFGILAPNGSKKIWSFFQNQSYGFNKSSNGSMSTFLPKHWSSSSNTNRNPWNRFLYDDLFIFCLNDSNESYLLSRFKVMDSIILFNVPWLLFCSKFQDHILLWRQIHGMLTQ